MWIFQKKVDDCSIVISKDGRVTMYIPKIGDNELTPTYVLWCTALSMLLGKNDSVIMKRVAEQVNFIVEQCKEMEGENGKEAKEKEKEKESRKQKKKRVTRWWRATRFLRRKTD